MYQRQEDESVQAFYKLYADWLETTPEDMAQFVEALAKITGLPRSGYEYPVEEEGICLAAEAFQKAAADVFGFSLDIENDQASQLDRFAERCLIDPALRSYFGAQDVAELSEEEAEQYHQAAGELRVPKEPLLYYCMGAFWGQWQVRHRQARWMLFPPLAPVQSFPDMITAGPTVCSHPFSQVCKKMSDPEGDNLEYKAKVSTGQNRYLPPYPLLASLADADYAVKRLLPEPAQQAVDVEEDGDDLRAWELYCEAAADNDQHPQMLSRMIACAWRLEKFEMVDGLSRRLLELAPEHPITCHNLAVLYSGDPNWMSEAIELLEAALRSDPNYSRAHMTLASCLAETGRAEEARQHAEWVRDNDQQLKEEAQEFLRGLG